MAKFSIKETHAKMAEARGQIEVKSAQIDTLKQKKDKLLEARTTLEGVASIDEETKEMLREALSSQIEQTESEAETVSDEISESTRTLEDGMQETQEAESDTARMKSDMEQRAAFLESIGVHGVLDGAKAKLEADLQGIEELKAEIIDARKKGEDAQRVASSVKN